MNMQKLTILGKKAFLCAVNRGKTSLFASKATMHSETLWGLFEEAKEVREASEDKPSAHIPKFSEVQEELGDVLIVCLTELYRRGTDIDELIYEKMQYNERRPAKLS